MSYQTTQRYLTAINRLTVIEAGIEYKYLFCDYCPIKANKQVNKVRKAKYRLIDLLQAPICC